MTSLYFSMTIMQFGCVLLLSSVSEILDHLLYRLELSLLCLNTWARLRRVLSSNFAISQRNNPPFLFAL